MTTMLRSTLPLFALAVGLATSAEPVLADAPAAPPAPTRPGSGVHFVYLVRHGIYDRDKSATDDRLHNGLNAQGHAQARLVADRLAQLPLRFDRLISSELLRAKETADDIGSVLHMTATRDAALNECTPTSLAPVPAGEMKRVAECDAARTLEWSRYFVATPDRDTVDLLVFHGNVIRWTLLRALGADTRAWPALDSANGSLSIIAVWPDGSAHVVSYDDVGHLPPALQTWSGRGGGLGAPR